MDAFTILFCFFLIPLASSSSASSNHNHCPPSYCGQNVNRVEYPFRLNKEQPETCGSPGFGLHCGNQSTLFMDLPKSSEFAVGSINYDSKTMQIYDPLNCLPARLLTLNLSGSPFVASKLRNFTLLTCPNEVSLSLGNFTTNIGCLSNSTFSTLATNASTSLLRSIIGNHTSCQIYGVLTVPGENQQDEQGFLGILNNDIYLTWNSYDREKCKGCRGADRPTREIKSSDDDHSDEKTDEKNDADDHSDEKNDAAIWLVMFVPIMLMVFAGFKMI